MRDIVCGAVVCDVVSECVCDVGVVETAKCLLNKPYRAITAPFSSQAGPGRVSITVVVIGQD